MHQTKTHALSPPTETLSPTARRLKVAALALVLIPFNVLMGAVPAAIGVAIPLAIVKLIVTGNADIFKTPWLYVLIGVAAVMALFKTVHWFLSTYGDGGSP